MASINGQQMFLSMYMWSQSHHQQFSVGELVVFLLTPVICTANVINVFPCPLSVFSAFPRTDVQNPGLVANGTRCDVGRVRQWISVLYIWYVCMNQDLSFFSHA